MKKWGLILVLGLILCLGLVAGCSDNDDPVDPPETVVLPEDPDLLMAEFVQVYEGMDGDRLAELMHPAAKVFLLPSTLAEWAGGNNPLSFTFFDRDSLLAVHENIFTGVSGRDAAGTPIPPVDFIGVEIFDKIGAWDIYEDLPEDFVGLEVYSVLYNVRLYFNNPDFHRFAVNQTVIMFVTEVEETDVSGWQLLGWRGLEPFARTATENTLWGDILCMYR